MARKVQVILSDDLDDSISADETVTFALDGTTYEIDLSEKNASEMRDVLGKYVSAARKVSSRGSRASGSGRSRATGGMGMGMDRLMMTLTGLGIRETILFPLVRPIHQ